MKQKGRHAHNELTAIRVNKLNEPGFYADGNGLYLKVNKAGSKQWIQRIMINGKRTDLGLGGVSLVSLKEARETAYLNRKEARAGGDPLADNRKEKDILSFEQAAREVHALNLPIWKNPKHAKQWISTLEHYAFPIIGKKKLDTITSADVLSVLNPIWTAKPETASRVRQRMGTVIKWAIAQQWRTDNPVDSITQALPKRDKKDTNHHQSLPYSQVADSIQTVQASGANIVTKLAFEFLVLTASRSGEVRGARWEEIDNDTWTIPKDRMKAKREHRVPLTKRCLDIVAEAKQLGDGSGLVFPGKGKPLSDSTLSKLLRDLGIQAVPHGFRSSFRVWASEQTGIPHQVCEFALAHVIGNKAEAAYMRTDLFGKRRRLMDGWADYLGGTKSGAAVVPISKSVTR